MTKCMFKLLFEKLSERRRKTDHGRAVSGSGDVVGVLAPGEVEAGGGAAFQRQTIVHPEIRLIAGRGQADRLA